jgi:hypothetical protein
MKEMMRDEKRFNCEDVHITLQATTLTNSRDGYQKKLNVARHVYRFRKKYHELAWIFLNTMNNVHHCHTLHNDMSSNKILLHFLPKSLDKVYIGICDWAMARNFNDLKESLYIHESQEEENTNMRHRWWVASELNYVLPPPGSTRDVDFERRPKFTLKSKTFAVGKIAQWIYGGNLFLEHYDKYIKEDRADDIYNHSIMNQLFQHSLEQLCKDDLDQRATLNRIMNRFKSTPFTWLVPNVGDTLRSYTEA